MLQCRARSFWNALKCFGMQSSVLLLGCMLECMIGSVPLLVTLLLPGGLASRQSCQALVLSSWCRVQTTCYMAVRQPCETAACCIVSPCAALPRLDGTLCKDGKCVAGECIQATCPVVPCKVSQNDTCNLISHSSHGLYCCFSHQPRCGRAQLPQHTHTPRCTQT